MKADVVAEFRRLTPASARHWRHVVEHVPQDLKRVGGVAPYPIYIERSEGPYLYDADGRQIVDFICGNMGMILGHNDPHVRASVQRQLERGTHYTLAPVDEARCAEMLCARIPSLERLRFTPTGNDATLLALRLARAYTGREKVAKVDGGFHGSHDAVWVGHHSWHHAQRPGRLAPGIPASIAEQVVVLPHNDVDRSAAIVQAGRNSLAAVIVEPVLGGGGAIPTSVAYLTMLRDLCSRHGIVLVFDEMISLGLGIGGAQERFGIEPDLTTAGKSVFAGMPQAFYGGRAEMMDLTGTGPHGEIPQMFHLGTYNGHPLAMAAGIASLEQQDEALYARIGALGDQMRAELRQLASRLGVPLQVTGVGHMWGWFWSTEVVDSYGAGERSDRATAAIVQTDLLNRGFYCGPHRAVVTAAHTPEHVRRYVDALWASLERLGAAQSPSGTRSMHAS
jgi:glutamate-1-semialdehyde 2,1-aminomutase